LNKKYLKTNKIFFQAPVRLCVASVDKLSK
jgi:hypothetical protein